MQESTGELAPSVQRYGLGYIRPYHREIARRLVLGQRAVDISVDLKISQARLSIVINSPLMQLEVKRLEDMRNSGVQDVSIQLQEVAPTMLEICERIAIFGKNENTSLSAAQDLLDRAGVSKVHKIDAHITTETHEQRLARYQRDKMEKNNIVETTVQVMNSSNNGESNNGDTNNEAT